MSLRIAVEILIFSKSFFNYLTVPRDFIQFYTFTTTLNWFAATLLYGGMFLNSFHLRKLTGSTEFKFWAKLFLFHFDLMPLRKV